MLTSNRKKLIGNQKYRNWLPTYNSYTMAARDFADMCTQSQGAAGLEFIPQDHE